jgi:small-conductance mechanosensitive channel
MAATTIPSGMSWSVVWPNVTFVLVTLFALLVREFALRALGRWLRGRDSAFLIDTIRLPSLVWCLVPGIAAAIAVADLPTRTVHILNRTFVAVIIASVTVTVANVVGVLIVRVGERRSLALAVTGLAQTFARVTVLVVGGLVLLGALGVQITPLLTALGVGGLAVALALQDTLSNLFAGLHLLADRPIRVGDYVKLADGVEGFVVDVGWRSTRVRQLQHSIAIVPNSSVAKATIVNYSLPEPRMGLTVRVSVDYGSDPDRVEAALLDEARRAVGEVPGLLGQPEPNARLIPGFGDAGLDFSLNVQVASYVDQYLVQHELRRRILRRFRAEGIAFPARALVVPAAAPSSDKRE